MAGALWAFLRKDDGQSFVELALAAPILVFALIGGIDLMRVAAINQAVQNAARVAADLAVSNTARCDDEDVPSSACDGANVTLWSTIVNELSGTPGIPALTPGTAVFCSVSPPAPGASPCMVRSLRDSDTDRISGMTAPPGLACTGSTPGGSICYLKVTVRYTFKTIVPWPGMPNTVAIDKSAIMPMVR